MDPKNKRLEITRGIKEGKAGIDRNYEDNQHKGIIRGFAVMTKGQVNDVRAWEIDNKTLDQIVEAGNAHDKLGLKSRFGHPNMSTTALGTFIGRARNFYRDGDIARADLYISKTAYATPDGDLASYVLDLAEKDPGAFGTSVVLGDFNLEYKIEKDGTPKKDEKGKALPPVLRVQSLLAVDTVDDPAANNGMFGKFFSSGVELSAKATESLDKLLSNPDALEYVIAFLERYRTNRDHIDNGKKNLTQTSTKQEAGQMEPKELTVEILSKERPDLVSALKAEGATEAVKAERTRVLSIVKAEHSEFPGMQMEAITEDALEKGLTIDATLASMRAKRLKDLEAKKNPAPGADGDSPEKKSHLEKAKKYQSEHPGCTITAALKATAEPRKAQ